MVLIEWTDATPVGVAVIDEQHRRLADLINRLHDAMQLRGRGKTIEPFLDELDAYAHYHFETEEQLMREHHCPALTFESHLTEHAEFNACLGSLKRDFEAGEFTLRLDLWQFVAKWWDRHVLGTDKELARELNARGFE